MKKIILLTVFIFCSHSLFSQYIFDLNISPTSDNYIVEVNLGVATTTISEFINEEHSITDNSIIMNVCYYVTGFQVSTDYQHNFPVTVPIDDDYIIIINLYRSESQGVCDYTELTDTATLEFTTPLTDPVYLGVAEFKEVSNQITVFPNPVRFFKY